MTLDVVDGLRPSVRILNWVEKTEVPGGHIVGSVLLERTSYLSIKLASTSLYLTLYLDRPMWERLRVASAHAGLYVLIPCRGNNFINTRELGKHRNIRKCRKR